MTLKRVVVIPNSERDHNYCLEAIKVSRESNYYFRYIVNDLYGGKKEFDIVFDDVDFSFVPQLRNLVSLAIPPIRLPGSSYSDYTDIVRNVVGNAKNAKNSILSSISTEQDAHNETQLHSLRCDIIEMPTNALSEEQVNTLSFHDAQEHLNVISKRKDAIHQHLHDNDLEINEANIAEAILKPDLHAPRAKKVVS